MIVAATPRPFSLSKFSFELSPLPREIGMQQWQQAHGSSACFRWLAW